MMDLLWLASLDPSIAYIDPGTGQAVLYALAAVATGIAFRFRQLKTWVVTKLTRRTEE